MTLFGRHHRERSGLAPDGTCPWCGATFPTDSLRDTHANSCPARPQETK